LFWDLFSGFIKGGFASEGVHGEKVVGYDEPEE